MRYKRQSEGHGWVSEHEHVIKQVEQELSILIDNGVFRSKYVSSVRVAVLVDQCKSNDSNTGVREYDDEKAKPIIDMAERGDQDARAALTEHFETLVQRNQSLPPNMAAHVGSVYSERVHPKPKRHSKVRDRNSWLGVIMQKLVDAGYPPNASNAKRTKTKPSASMIMVEAYDRVCTNAMPRLARRSFEKIWEERQSQLKELPKGADPPRGVFMLLRSGRTTRP